MNKVEKKRQREQHVVEEMIQLYCRKNHSKEERQGRKMCPVCQELSDYAKLRSQKCPFMEQKTFCANCKVHCYKPEKREQICQVMRFSGPRMILYHPFFAVWHLICSKKEKGTYDKTRLWDYYPMRKNILYIRSCGSGQHFCRRCWQFFQSQIYWKRSYIRM